MDFFVVRTKINKKKIVIFFVMLGPWIFHDLEIVITHIFFKVAIVFNILDVVLQFLTIKLLVNHVLVCGQ
jgi:hypothetical protein